MGSPQSLAPLLDTGRHANGLFPLSYCADLSRATYSHTEPGSDRGPREQKLPRGI